MREEDAIHEAIVQYLDYALRPPAMYWHTPNTFSSAKPAFHAKLKRMGRKAGIPDLLVLHDGRLIGLEVKAKKGRQNPDQRAIEACMADCGAYYHIVRSVEDVQKVLVRRHVIAA